MQRTVLDLWVGAFVLAGIGALVILAFKVGNMSTYNGSDTYRLQAYFTNIGGLRPTASVRSAGVLVGRVGAITLDTERYQARVELDIDKRYQFPADTFANILTSGLLGEQYIGLLPGGDDEMLAEGGQFKQTQSAMVLEDLIGKFMLNQADAKK
ncbi:MAG: outer membrane lipid asymmetry maintenance protein MlaD [Gallionella sp.]|nr:outer membrane lipid asymmetry maintenance protein MlaD [Gallionella sp.]PIR09022.1 MAG: outer membrane lipid asymmetry maintenance protein MlaD [Gallionellaceae bacterium CG11_big_fil_rev_8_21_14_0_20_60_62]PIV47856.1 MAG: outer membrane lipid asymmetry maintenance protein MlaD [Gallionellaceae bacterium CG02_land_8_20_14_3_00_60_115]PIY06415.1 MAG: outer membrane lipid asymmetry maintenance protein MlaD [Gallionellaceae bacterium CG_4_10_14_3_um_filter_60_1069]PJC04213.1 MAG: outer membran